MLRIFQAILNRRIAPGLFRREHAALRVFFDSAYLTSSVTGVDFRLVRHLSTKRLIHVQVNVLIFTLGSGRLEGSFLYARPSRGTYIDYMLFAKISAGYKKMQPCTNRHFRDTVVLGSHFEIEVFQKSLRRPNTSDETRYCIFRSSTCRRIPIVFEPSICAFQCMIIQRLLGVAYLHNYYGNICGIQT